MEIADIVAKNDEAAAFYEKGRVLYNEVAEDIKTVLTEKVAEYLETGEGIFWHVRDVDEDVGLKAVICSDCVLNRTFCELEKISSRQGYNISINTKYGPASIDVFGRGINLRLEYDKIVDFVSKFNVVLKSELKKRLIDLEEIIAGRQSWVKAYEDEMIALKRVLCNLED